MGGAGERERDWACLWNFKYLPVERSKFLRFLFSLHEKLQKRVHRLCCFQHCSRFCFSTKQDMSFLNYQGSFTLTTPSPTTPHRDAFAGLKEKKWGRSGKTQLDRTEMYEPIQLFWTSTHIPCEFASVQVLVETHFSSSCICIDLPIFRVLSSWAPKDAKYMASPVA